MAIDDVLLNIELIALRVLDHLLDTGNNATTFCQENSP
jgi:hypothetical protein